MSESTEPEVETPVEPDPAVEVAPARGRWVAIAVIGVVAVVGPLWIRAVVDGTMALADADEAERNGDTARTIEHLGHALRWRAPFSSHDEEALERLWAIAETARANGPQQRDTALVAYREVRRGLLATRVIDIPHRERWDDANEHIAQLMAEQRKQMKLDVDPSLDGDADAATVERRRLSKPPGPRPIIAHLAAVAFVAWLLSIGGFVTRGLDAKGRLRPRAALRWGLAAVAALIAWTVLLAVSH